MKALVKIIKVEDEFTYYQEISRTTGKVIIEDFMQTERFEKALQLDNGFQLVDDLVIDLTAQATKPLKECKETLNFFRRMLGLKWKQLPKNTTDQFNYVRRLIK